MCSETLESLCEFFEDIIEKYPIFKTADVSFGVSIFVHHHHLLNLYVNVLMKITYVNLSKYNILLHTHIIHIRFFWIGTIGFGPILKS